MEEDPESPAGSQKDSTFLKEEKEMFKRRLFLSLVLIAIPASADVLQVSVSGTFNNLAAATDVSSPNAAWVLTFDVDSQPTPISHAAGGFETTASNLEYDLAGHAVSGLSFDPANPPEFLISADGGGTVVDLKDADGDEVNFSVKAQQLFLGATSTPEFLTRTFTVTDSIVGVMPPRGAAFIGSPNATSITITDLSAAPEPSTNLLLGTGLAGTAFLLRRRRRFAAPHQGSRS